MKRFIFVCLLARMFHARAADVDHLSLASAVLGRDMEFIVVRPAGYDSASRDGAKFPVLYLLHCAGCSHTDWINEYYCEGLEEELDSAGILAVAPREGSYYTWWLESPVLDESRMSSFLIQELKPYVDSAYATCADRGNTAAAGHSMGGFGAFHNAMYYPETFGAAVSIKGGLDLLNPNWPTDFGLSYVLGDTATHRENWEWATVVQNAHHYDTTNTRLLLFRGIDGDWFSEENLRLHGILDSLDIAHEYVELQEDHYNVSRSTTEKMIGFCDSVFTRCTPAESDRGWRFPGKDIGRRRRVFAVGAAQPVPGSDGMTLYTVWGREVRMAEAGQIARGVYVAVYDRHASRPACLPYVQ
ncbi:MAG: prolyl oligopeptidase family serine peptidase [Chitinivibrionales bacterium]|nr:prolyl oligopeptidase family serine peptidase [Chitinivibrionales bacterium]MBD3395487.1 prolyl oligopeptidase family serine peptidase [Chitinivibrionales bacterium]